MSNKKKIPVTTTGKYNHLNEFHLPLTSQSTQHISRQVGKGSFSIGANGISEGAHEAWVDADDVINWPIFDEIDFPGHKNHKLLQSFHYTGNDTTFIDWSSNRPIRFFHFKPTKDLVIDLTTANIQSFILYVEQNKVELSLGEKANSVTLHGNLENVVIKKCPEVCYLSFKSFQKRQDKSIYQLPSYPNLNPKSVYIFGEVTGEPFDCTSLLQFPQLTSLYLSGNVVNLSALAKLEQIERINLQFIPDMQEVPKLTTWQSLNDFSAENVEETAGKRLRTEVKSLKKEGKLNEFSSVLKLRKSIWFSTEYGIPFSNWESKNAKVATKAYKACLKEIKQAKTEQEIQLAIGTFVNCINALSDIDTEERENVGTAVGQLVESATLNINKETWENWFDELRDF